MTSATTSTLRVDSATTSTLRVDSEIGPLREAIVHRPGLELDRLTPDTVADLRRFDLGLLAPGHCTGWRAMSVMAREFGDELAPTAVGKRYLIGG